MIIFAPIIFKYTTLGKILHTHDQIEKDQRKATKSFIKIIKRSMNLKK